MLFNSYPFILAFLPLTLLLFYGLRQAGFTRGTFALLTLASLVFYGWWNPVYLLLLIPLMLANFALAKGILRYRLHSPAAGRLFMLLGVTGNLAVLGYFKYANFFVDNLDALLGFHLALAKIVLPLGISFFIFQKIALLVDAWHGKFNRLNLLDYLLFVTLFPQLIAGPIVHHSEVMPQFHHKKTDLNPAWFALGLTIFAIGLAKKVLLADTAAAFATPQFNAAAAGIKLDFLAGWSGALAYTAQLYFDFSGYSDMAIGTALLFGIRLPVNFASPYKAASIIDFWRMWHITLSRFLRDYLYIPLGGNRKGPARRHLNLFLTMLLGGFWHGAGWTYVLWGALHGVYLGINHAWRTLRGKWTAAPASRLEQRCCQAATFSAVVVGWVFFRARDVHSAVQMLKAMAGFNGILLPASLGLPIHQPALPHGQVDTGLALLVSVLLLGIAWLAPNTQQLTGYRGPDNAPDPSPGHVTPAWRLSPRWAVAVGCLLAASLMSLTKVSEFLYFQF